MISFGLRELPITNAKPMDEPKKRRFAVLQSESPREKNNTMVKKTNTEIIP